MAEGSLRCADELIGMLDELMGFEGDDNPKHAYEKQRLPAELRAYASPTQHSKPKQPPLFSTSADFGSSECKPVLLDTHPQEDAKQLLEKIKQRNREKQARHRARVKVCERCIVCYHRWIDGLSFHCSKQENT